jgi:hypothetical protein
VKDFFLDHTTGCIIGTLFALVLLVGGMALFENWDLVRRWKHLDAVAKLLYKSKHEDKPLEKPTENPHGDPADVHSSFEPYPHLGSSSAAATGSDKPANRRRRK